ncbi:hypothetical protein [Methanothermococcus okinawensis]|uniref:Uncharacterized protein n=1 Tax=Methanothermococcus okinawensis (strain DSM 14208 / JCM 11175 / IH1) TaxID=647113 RepID=F8AM90_METOI|nr:hypothetical protein [Methanothermococcus okinawensis]AEH06779.1 hypothetical protein Metok_0802 [Methanothermococcus okinawensis IH1]
MASIMEEGNIIVIKDKKVADKFLKDLIETPTGDIPEYRIKRINRLVEEGKRWAKQMKL